MSSIALRIFIICTQKIYNLELVAGTATSKFTSFLLPISGKRIAKQKKGRNAGSEAQTLERDPQFLSKLDLSCLIGKGGTGFIKAPESTHAVIKYARYNAFRFKNVSHAVFEW